MNAHGARSHATWSASATARNWACPGALTLSAGVVGRTSEAAAWGTCCHQLAEHCLRDSQEVVEYLGSVETADGFAFTVDEEMVETARVYVEYVQRRRQEHASGGMLPLTFIEQRFTLATLNPPFEAGGTADAVIYFKVNKELEIVDLKGGRGVVVEVAGNPQLRTYALGALLANPGLDVEIVTVTIVQPRAPHKDGRIRSETFHVADLLEWTGELMAAMLRAKAAETDHKLMPTGQWAAQYLTAGDHCKFCPAAGFCPALAQRALDAAGVWFDDQDAPRISNAPSEMSPEELAKKLDMSDMLKEWLAALWNYAHAQAEIGVVIPGYKLVEKVGNRAWRNDTVAIHTFSGLDLTDEDMFQPPKLKSPVQMEKLIGAKHKHLIEDLVERQIRGTNLVAVSKSSRPAVESIASKFFQPVET